MSIFTQARQQADERAASIHHCDHRSTRLTFLVCSNGAIQFVKQCNDCGEKTSSPIAHKKLSWADKMFAPPYDRTAHEQSRKAFYDERRNERSEAFWRTYQEYLNSPEWTARRNRILKRDKYICQLHFGGCTKHASQVHHLSYTNIGNERDNELMSVCVHCHEIETQRSRSTWVTM